MIALLGLLLTVATVLGVEIFNPEEAGAPLMAAGNHKQNKCIVVPNGTPVQILETDILEKYIPIKKVRVRILDGPCKGDEGFVLEMHLKK